MTEPQTQFQARIANGIYPRGLALRMEMEPERDWSRPDPEDWPYDIPVPPAPPGPEDLVRRLLETIELGFFGCPSKSTGDAIRSGRSEQEERLICEIVASLPAISRAGVGCFLRCLLRGGMPWGLISLDASELGVTDAPILRSADAFAPLAMPVVPFELSVDRFIEQRVVVEIELERDLDELATDRLTSISRSWAALIEHGAFRGALGLPFCDGGFEAASPNLANEWVITVDGYLGDREVVAPLLEALAVLHERRPIASVLVRSSS